MKMLIGYSWILWFATAPLTLAKQQARDVDGQLTGGGDKSIVIWKAAMLVGRVFMWGIVITLLVSAVPQ
jgi:hypothetical protein